MVVLLTRVVPLVLFLVTGAYALVVLLLLVFLLVGTTPFVVFLPVGALLNAVVAFIGTACVVAGVDTFVVGVVDSVKTVKLAISVSNAPLDEE